ncbi:MAG: hypothetical protein U5N86_01020 [Planctomycetota bacterium]|nr:hypothetical protein [Planctomycetota bacterium]
MSQNTQLFSKSPVTTLFRLAVILLAIEVLWLTTLFQHYNPSDFRVNLDKKVAVEDFERKNRIAENTIIFAGLAAILILCGYGAFKLQQLRAQKLLVGDEEFCYGPKCVKYCEVRTLLFDCGASGTNRMTMNGLLVQVEDKRDTSIEGVMALNSRVEDNANPDEVLDASFELVKISGFTHFRDNEELALLLAEKLKEANPEARIMTVVDKYKKQRVVYEA